MKKIRIILPLVLIALFLSSNQIHVADPTGITLPSFTATYSATRQSQTASSVTLTPQDVSNQTADIQPTPTPTPDPVPSLLDCALELRFSSGPFKGKSTDFTVLGRDYFFDKGDKFFPGKNTAVYYEDVHYLILHSAFHNGNILKPLEAEFIRFYLEYWGDPDPAYVLNKIDELMGSEVQWFCNNNLLFTTYIQGIVRLSYEASNQLWLEPWNLHTILKNKEGLVSEWIGEIEPTDDPRIFLGFCGWGPHDSGDERFVYYRYLVDMRIQD